MAIAATVEQHLASKGVGYKMVTHRRTGDSMHTAEAAHVSGDGLAKTVVLQDDRGCLAAILPATHRLRLDLVRDLTGRSRLELAAEDVIAKLFQDCSVGAMPAVTAAYGMSAIWDKRLSGLETIHFEGGDHESLLGVSGSDFATLMGDAPCGIISDHM